LDNYLGLFGYPQNPDCSCCTRRFTRKYYFRNSAVAGGRRSRLV